MRRAWAVAAALALVLAAQGPAVAASGSSGTSSTAAQKQKQQQVKQQIAGLRDQVQEASAEESDLLGKLDDVTATRQQLDAQVADLDGKIADVQKAVDAASAKFDDLSAQLNEARLKLQIATDEEAAARNELRARAVEAYINHPELNAAGFIMHADSLRAVAAGEGYYKAVINEQRLALKRYVKLKDDTEGARKAVEDRRDAARDEQGVVVAQRQQLEAVRNDRDSVRQQVVAQEQQQEQLLSEIQSKKADFEAQIAALQQQSNAITLLLQGIQVGQIAIQPGSGVLTAPIPGAPITSGFGPRVHPIFHDVRMHTGIDFGATQGTPIHAAADGTVVSAGVLGGYGNATVIDHGSSMATLYGHQSAILVTAGQHVLRGQVIGLVGCTGFCTGPHLHFEVRIHGTPVDPMPYL
jgi:murein DD-endopeptidase MepM/ murein hydrolase activator NlpD